MRILVNGVWRETRSPQLAATLAELGYGGRIVATAVNDEFVAADAYSFADITAVVFIDMLRMAKVELPTTLAPLCGWYDRARARASYSA